MNKLIRLSPTGIEYGDYAWNFVSGCGNNIDGKCKVGGFRCWAYSITQRFADRYPNGFKPTIYPEALLSPLYLKKPSRILCAFMGDLFWDCSEFHPERALSPYLPKPIPETCFTLHGTLRQIIFGIAKACPQHTFLFLTKQPQNLSIWSPFPRNAYVGVSATNQEMFDKALYYLGYQTQATVKFVSIEPYLSLITTTEVQLWDFNNKKNLINQLIIGAQTKPTVYPKIEWVQEIVETCDKAGVAVFLKDNLIPLLPDGEEPFYKCGNDGDWRIRQEMPK